MDTSVVVAGVTALPVLIASLAQWRDMRRRTNGEGPLAAKLDEQTDRLVRIEDRIGRTEERVGRIESQISVGAQLDRSDARADRAEEIRVARRERP